VGTRTDLIAVSGRIDRLDDRRPDDTRPGETQPGDLVVVDYKTGRHQLTVDDARTSLALALYALAAERVLRRPCRSVELHHLPTGKVLAWEHTTQSLTRQLRRAEDIAAECADADERYKAATAGGPSADAVFQPRPGPGCGWCDYRAHCPEGRAASPQRRPWDALGMAGGEEADGVLASSTVPADGVAADGVAAGSVVTGSVVTGSGTAGGVAASAPQATS
jgi:RecB family exonuclease